MQFNGPDETKGNMKVDVPDKTKGNMKVDVPKIQPDGSDKKEIRKRGYH